VSRDVTTPLSGTVCHPSAETSYDQPVHKIWSLYVYSLRTYERRRKMKKLGWFGGIGVTQGHQKHRHLIDRIWLPIRLIETMRLSCTVWVLVHFSLKVANVYPPHLHLLPPYGVAIRISPWALVSEN